MYSHQQAIESARLVYPLVGFINSPGEVSSDIYEGLIELSEGWSIDMAERVEASELFRPHILFSKGELMKIHEAAEAHINRLEEQRIEEGFPEDREIWECLQYPDVAIHERAES